MPKVKNPIKKIFESKNTRDKKYGFRELAGQKPTVSNMAEIKDLLQNSEQAFLNKHPKTREILRRALITGLTQLADQNLSATDKGTLKILFSEVSKGANYRSYLARHPDLSHEFEQAGIRINQSAQRNAPTATTQPKPDMAKLPVTPQPMAGMSDLNNAMRDLRQVQHGGQLLRQAQELIANPVGSRAEIEKTLMSAFTSLSKLAQPSNQELDDLLTTVKLLQQERKQSNTLDTQFLAISLLQTANQFEKSAGKLSPANVLNAAMVQADLARIYLENKELGKAADQLLKAQDNYLKSPSNLRQTLTVPLHILRSDTLQALYNAARETNVTSHKINYCKNILAMVNNDAIAPTVEDIKLATGAMDTLRRLLKVETNPALLVELQTTIEAAVGSKLLNDKTQFDTSFTADNDKKALGIYALVCADSLHEVSKRQIHDSNVPKAEQNVLKSWNILKNAKDVLDKIPNAAVATEKVYTSMKETARQIKELKSLPEVFQSVMTTINEAKAQSKQQTTTAKVMRDLGGDILHPIPPQNKTVVTEKPKVEVASNPTPTPPPNPTPTTSPTPFSKTPKR